MDALNRESNIIDTSLTTSVASNNLLDTKFDKYRQIIKESHTNIIKVVENAILSIEYVEEMEVMQMKDAKKFMCDTYAKVDDERSLNNHCSNKDCNTIPIIEQCGMYLHHYR